MLIFRRLQKSKQKVFKKKKKKGLNVFKTLTENYLKYMRRLPIF